MLYENINCLNEGMVVGKDIVDANTNRVLLKSGSKLTNFYIKYLKDNGYKGIYIESENYKKIIVEDIIPTELKNSSIKALRDLDIESVLENARSIVDHLFYKKDISFDNHNLKVDTYEHSIKVAEMSIVIGKAIGLKKEELVELAEAALLHDIGKCVKNKENLKKLGYDGQIGTYNENLYPLYSYEIIKNHSEIKATTKVGVLTHNMDENGRNNMIMNKNVKQHLYGKIIHVADIYDQIITHTYHDRIASPSEATELLLGGCGTKFNETIVKQFLKYIPIYPKGTKVKLSNGMNGVVFENNQDIPLRPKVIVENGKIIDLSNFEYNNITILDKNNQEFKKRAM